MSSSEPLIYCPNLACSSPINRVGREVCESCQTPLIYRYLWATGTKASQFPVGEQVAAGRYRVVATQVWLDIQPGLAPDLPDSISPDIQPYLQLYPYRLHVPMVYGVCHLKEGTPANVLLLENAPISSAGNAYPAITAVWFQALAVRQVHWLWQILQLWQPLADLGVASSLLVPENLRVEGWRLRLRELYADPGRDLAGPLLQSGPRGSAPTLKDLAACWLKWVPSAQAAIAKPLEILCQQMQQEDASLEAIAEQLNQLLLEQAAQLPLRLQTFGASDTGKEHSHNEDACYPTKQDILASQINPNNKLIPGLAIVCDGIGGHEGGEVASQLAVRSLKLQMRALLAEVAEQPELVSPDLLMGQIEAAIRVVNNLIASQNNTQGRESRQRMGTTLVMALQIPQSITLASGSTLSNSHELYLAHVGDSRAYWITPHYCQLLTVDDDVAGREVRSGRSLYRAALKRDDAAALTQALGTRDAEFLRPTVRRFLLDEDGLLLLCSDGLSDNGLVEESWPRYAESVVRGQTTLEAAVEALIELANQKNGYDNTSIVLTSCRLASEHYLDLFTPKKALSSAEPVQTEFSEASRALLYGEVPEPEASEVVAEPKPVAKPKPVVVSLMTLLLVAAAGILAWSQLDPRGFQQFRQQLPGSRSEQPIIAP